MWGKPSVPVHKPLGHIPLIVAWPGAAPTSIDALTTSTDIHATLADVFGATINHRTHGSSLVPLISGAAKSVRDWLLTGVWGREVQLVTEQWRYTRGPVGGNAPQTEQQLLKVALQESWTLEQLTFALSAYTQRRQA